MTPSHPPISAYSFIHTIVCACGAFGALVVIGSIGTGILPSAHTESGLILTSWSSEPDESSLDGDAGMRECIITLISGRRITGELIYEDTLVVVIGINGIETTFQRKKIASIKILPPVAQRYTTLRESIPDDDIDARLTLVEWLRIRRAYDLALSELESILIEDPLNPRAKLLFTWLSEYAKLIPTEPTDQSTTDSEPDLSPKADPKARPTRKGRPARNGVPTLTPEQINLMRVYEIDLRDPPKIKVPDSTLEELMKRKPDAFSPNKDERKAIFKLSEIEKLKVLFTHKARDLYAQVVVLEDPNSMKAFKQDVHSRGGWLINACASTRCHGGTDAGRFQLINAHPNADETVYTNFYIIEHYTLADGTPLINYQAPERSPLLQMGLVKKNTLTPHPEIPAGYPGTGFRPIFRSTRDRKYRDAIDWIRSMYQPRPEYGFVYPIQPEPNHTTPSTDPSGP